MLVTTSLSSVLFSLALVSESFQATSSDSSFNPREYAKRTTNCKAVKRDADNALVNITLSYVDMNPSANTTLVLLHGWPSLWSTWSYQIQEFKRDYHLIIPDLRGFGSSTHPDDVKGSGTLYDLVGDLQCILEDANVDSGVCVGHDWGSAVCYEAARSRPDIITGVIGVVVPYIPSAGAYVPIEHLTAAIPKLTYQLFFDRKTAEAAEELNKDMRRTVRATLRTKDSPPPEDYLTSPHSFLDAWGHVEEIPPVPFFTLDEEDYFVEQYQLQGFKNTHNTIGQNRYASWKFAHEQGNHTIPQPALAILPTDDPVADWVIASRLLHSEEFLPSLTTEILPGAHWVHLESPHLFNAAMRKWLNKYFPNHELEAPELDPDRHTGHVEDEL
ncbi:Alpha/Beta hydrolase protein [Lentinula aciculospora]|uniref:Alpha/Beta hydrolase protein n=1 Tax=Lentinula aciculospora TaxID=153920 RepID=A0A9W8ZWA7_9AGAR|nr:Alpha/Beta hydrolase protein [Lentinula aciculospora]